MLTFNNDRLLERLRSEGALCMYLMSEIGPTLYERMGYVARPLRICRFAAADPSREAPRQQTWRWLTEADVPSTNPHGFTPAGG